MADTPSSNTSGAELFQPTAAQSSRPPSDRVARTTSTRSSSTVKAQKAAAEALALRRRLDHELELAARERERDRHLAALQQEVVERELQAELTAIDANAGGSRSGSRSSRLSSTRVSVDRTKNWIENHCDQSRFVDQRDRGISAVGCEDHIVLPSPGRSVPQPAATRAPVPSITLVQPTQALSVTKLSEALAPPIDPLEPNMVSSPLLQAVADTAAAAKALATAQSCKKLDLVPFFGNTLQWLHFKRTYDATKMNFSVSENLTRLQNALRGPARVAVGALLMSTEDPEEVMRALEDNFARPELIVYQEVNGLKNLPRLGNELKELGTLSNRVRNSVSTIKMLNQIEYLYSPELFHAVLGKLNPTMKLRWTDFAIKDNTGRPKLEILSDFLKCELEQHIKFGLSPDSSGVQQTQLSLLEKQLKRENINTVTHLKSESFSKAETRKQECVFCKKDHNIKSCSKFKLLSIDDKWQWLREFKICYRCLKGSSHQWKTCKVNPCGIDGCHLRHHPLLHQKSPTSPVNTTNTQNTNTQSTIDSDNILTVSNEPVEQKVIVSTTSTGSHKVNSNITLCPRVLLKVVPVTISGPAGTCNAYALLDDGSTATLIDSSVAARIGAAGPQEVITINGIGGLERNATVSFVDFHIKGRYTEENFLVRNARVLDSLCLRPQTIHRESIAAFSHLTDLVEFMSYENATPAVLIGSDQWHLSINRDVRVGGRNEPVACLTALGWTLYGVAPGKAKLIEFVNHGTFTEPSNDDNLEFLIKEHYKIDSLGISKTETLLNKQDQRALEILQTTSRRLSNGRFEVGLPWRDDIQRIPDSYPQAMSRFLSLERRMIKEP